MGIIALWNRFLLFVWRDLHRCVVKQKAAGIIRLWIAHTHHPKVVWTLRHLAQWIMGTSDGWCVSHSQGLLDADECVFIRLLRVPSSRGKHSHGLHADGIHTGSSDDSDCQCVFNISFFKWNDNLRCEQCKEMSSSIRKLIYHILMHRVLSILSRLTCSNPDQVWIYHPS